MHDDFTKNEKKAIRDLAGLAWERQLRAAIETLGQSIAEMSSGKKDPFEVADEIHKYHDGTAGDLYTRYALSKPWFSVCLAYCDQVFTAEDLLGLPERVHAKLIEQAEVIRKIRE